MAFVVFSSVGGSVIGPIVGAFQHRYLSWHWNVSCCASERATWPAGSVRRVQFEEGEADLVPLRRLQFWLQLIFGGATQLLHWFTPETKASVLMTRAAKRRRAAGDPNIYSPDELKERRFAPKEVLKIMSRPVS